MEEEKAETVFGRAKKKKGEKSLQPTIQALTSLVTAIVAVLGIVLSYMSISMTRDARLVNGRVEILSRTGYKRQNTTRH